MAIREIRKFPDPVLRKKAAPVKTIDDNLRRLIDDMVETMYAEPGVGLAAPQIGVSQRVFVIDSGWNLDQQEISLKGRGLLARAFQHEIDHLDGLVIWDRMGKIQREILKGEWKRLQREAVKG
ncbi:MAG: peptide deformylase [Nitrospinae bacterium]|nr:peptide deformylase [Nitrospinota bacterium]